MADVIQRKNRSDLWVPAETAIQNAINAVEEMPPDPILTDAIVTLSRAKDLVSAYVDDEIEKKNIDLRKRIGEWCFDQFDEPQKGIDAADDMFVAAMAEYWKIVSRKVV